MEVLDARVLFCYLSAPGITLAMLFAARPCKIDDFRFAMPHFLFMGRYAVVRFPVAAEAGFPKDD